MLSCSVRKYALNNLSGFQVRGCVFRMQKLSRSDVYFPTISLEKYAETEGSGQTSSRLKASPVLA